MRPLASTRVGPSEVCFTEMADAATTAAETWWCSRRWWPPAPRWLPRRRRRPPPPVGIVFDSFRRCSLWRIVQRALTSRTIVRGSVSVASHWKTPRYGRYLPGSTTGCSRSVLRRAIVARWPPESSSPAPPATSGGRLLHRLESSGRQVRCLTRRPEALATRIADGTEVVAGDVLDAASLRRAMAGVRGGLLPDPLDGDLDEVRGARPDGGAQLRPGGSLRRSTPHRLPGWARERRSAVPASGEPAGGRRHPAFLGSPDDRVSRLDRDRLRQRVVRARARARREPARDHRPAVGRDGRAADRHRGRPRVPAGGARARGRSQRDLRDRRRRPGDLRGGHP